MSFNETQKYWKLLTFQECNAPICELRDDKYDGGDGSTGMKLEALEDDLFEQRVQTRLSKGFSQSGNCSIIEI